MGLVGSKARKAFRRFNLESRVEKVLSKEKPDPAPRYPADEKHWSISPDGATKEDLVKKDMKLDSHLKDVYVTSFDPPAVKNPKFVKPSDRDRLPQFRGIVEQSEMGFTETEHVPEGKLSLRQAMKILTAYQEDPWKNNANAVASQYKLSLSVADNLLNYFASLNVKINDPKDAQLKLKDTKMTRPTIVGIEEGIAKNPK